MIDSQQFKPYKPEETIVCEITKREAVLLSKLRRHAYGKFVIHKVDAVLVRIEINDSQLIKEDETVNLD